tara:strand:- start:22 stop:336 length:315 start_codon:yes stop_codon:yes gene_type:complete
MKKGEDFAQISIRKYEMLQKIKRELHSSVFFTMDSGPSGYGKYHFYSEKEGIKVLTTKVEEFEKAYKNQKRLRVSNDEYKQAIIDDLKIKLAEEKKKKGFWSFL